MKEKIFSIASATSRFERGIFVFLLVYLIFLCFLTPPFQVADENAHFYRTIQVSQFEIFPSRQENTIGGEIPASLIDSSNILQAGIPFNPQNKFSLKLLRSEMERKFDAKDKKFIGFPNTALYSPIPYLFSGGTLWIAKVLSVSPPLHLYVARVTNSIAAVAIIFMGLAVFPFLNFPILLLSFVPMYSFQLASASADSVMFSLAVLYCCSLGKAFTEPENPVENKIPYFILSIVSFALLALCKQAYFPLGLPLAILLFEDFNQKKIFSLKIGIALLISLPVFYWNFRIRDYFAPSRLDVVIDPGKQLQFIINSPQLFIDLLIQSIRSSGGVLWQQMIGVLGWLDTWLNPKINDILGYLLFGSVLMPRRGSQAMRNVIRITLFAGIISSALLIVMLIYMSWNPPGHLANIEGLQGRYFLPLLPFVFAFIISFPKLKVSKYFRQGTNFSNFYMLSFVALSLWTTIYGLLRRYYL